MIYLAMTLHAEGPTDHAFLEPVIRRTLNDCARRMDLSSLIEIATPFVELPPCSRENDAILAAVIHALDGIHLFFLHTDGKGQPERARAQRIEPVLTSLQAEVPVDRLGCVGIVPVHGTEAWPLADPDCVRQVFGTNRSDAELGLLANPHEVEGDPDPKQRLAEVWQSASRARKSRRRKGDYRPFLTVLGETIDLERLRRVRAYQRFEHDLTTALHGLMPAG